MNFLRSIKHELIAIALGLVVYFIIPDGTGLTMIGHRMLALMVAVIYLWLSEDPGWPSLIMVAGLVACGLDYKAVFAGSWGNFLIPTLITTLAMTYVLEETGATEYVASWFYTRKIVEGRPYVFIYMLLIALFVMSLVLNPTATVILFMNIAKVFMEKMGYKKGDKYYTIVMLSILWVGATSEVATPIGHPQPLVMIGLISMMTGHDVTVLEWMKVGLPFCLVMLVLTMIFIRFSGIDVSKYTSLDIEEIRRNRAALTTEGKVSGAIFILVLIAWLMPELAKLFSPELASFSSRLSMAVPSMIGLALMAAIRVKGKPVTDVKMVFTKVPWGIVVFTTALLAISGNISTSETGVVDFLRSMIAPLTQSLSPVMLLVFVLCVTTVMTNCLSNTVSMSMMFALAAPILAVQGGIISYVGLGLLVCGAANMAFLMAPSSTYCVLFFGEHFGVKETLRYNIMYMVIGVLLLLLVMFPLARILMPL